MAWSQVVLFQSRSILILDVVSTAAIDIELEITHGLGHTPMWINIMAHNAAANAAGYWVDDIDETVVHLHKPNGGADSQVHLCLWTLRLNPPWAANFQLLGDSGP